MLANFPLQADGCSPSFVIFLLLIGQPLEAGIMHDRVMPACKALLDELPVSDIDIEELIRRIFAR